MGRQSTKHEAEDLRKARQAAKNTFEFVCGVLADRKNWYKNKLIVDVSGEVTAWHHEQNKTNRSASESASWHCARALDRGLAHVDAILKKVSSAELLQSLGVHWMSSDKHMKSLETTDPLVAEQDERAALLALYCVNLASRRLRSMSWFETYPYKFAGLLSQDPGKVAEIVKEMKQDYECWSVMDGKAGSWWKRAQERCPLRHAHTRMLTEALTHNGWQLSGAGSWPRSSGTTSHKQSWLKMATEMREPWSRGRASTR